MYLNCHTYYSLRYGTFSVEALCELAQKNQVNCLALTDINNTSGCLRFLKIAENYNIKPLIGIDFRNGTQQQYVGIARNNKGFEQLNEYLSRHLHQGKNFDEEAPELSDCYFIYPFEKVVADKKTHFKQNEFIGISREKFRKLKFSKMRFLEEKLVLLQTVSFRNKKDFSAHRLLRCIGENILLSQLPKTEQGRPTDRMIPQPDLETEFEDYPHILENTRLILDDCNVNFNFGNARENQNLQVFGNSKEEDAEILKNLCYQEFPKKYKKPSAEVYARVERELKAIIDLGFVSYFLINHDIIRYAKSKKYPYIGRGSGANSVVAYIIGITNVDPIELDLYFERFINPSRNSPPDFDLDFSWKDRDDITAYIFKKYPNTALLATYVTFKRKAVARELGKVFGLPKTEIDKLSAGFFKYEELDEMEQLVLKYTNLIQGFPNYLSVHSGGIMIANNPVYSYTATFLPPKGFPTIQFDMHVAEEVGIFKFDILAQRGLPKITDAIEIIKQNQPTAYIENIDNVAVFKNDPNINELLKNGDCMGVFYVESPAMRGLLTKLQTNDYLGLVAASSIIRPGVANGGMKEEYIKRHRDVERRKQAHPVMYEIMPDTYGVMVYQEDVLKVAHHFADLSLEEADILRRGMSRKKVDSEEYLKIEKKFKENCKAKGYQEELILEIWNQIQAFAGYAFPKGHSASYAVESYQSLYLKRYFPLEFMVAVLNNGGGFYNLETYIEEIRKCGGTIHAPCINKSDHPNVIYEKDIYLGLGYLRELEDKVIRRILENKQFFGPFQSFDDFIDRITISIEQLTILLRIDAFRFTGIDKHHLLWKAHFKLNNSRPPSSQEVLFKTRHKDFELPELERDFLIDAYDQIALLGFPLYNHFHLLRDPLQPAVKCRDLKNYIGKRIQIYGNLISISSTYTSKKGMMYFGTFYDIEGNIFDTVHFPKVAEKYPVRNKGIFLCSGTVAEELGYISVTLTKIERQHTLGDPRLKKGFSIPK